MMKNTKRSSKRKGKMNKKEYKKWLGLLCAMIGLCVILLSVLLLENPGNSKQPALLSAD